MSLIHLLLILLGSDQDEYGCTPSAGYSWCPHLEKCIRTWETKCEAKTIGHIPYRGKKFICLKEYYTIYINE